MLDAPLYPQLLAERGFELLTYPVETVLAEKLTTALHLGALNTRERDYADIWRLIGRHDLDGTTCTQAVERTAAWRGIGLRPLSPAIGSLAGRREVDWRRGGPSKTRTRERTRTATPTSWPL